MKRLALAILLVALSAGAARVQADCHDDCTVAAVPDGGTTLTLMAGAMVGLGMLRRKFRG